MTRVLLLKKYPEHVLKAWLLTVHRLLCVCPEDHVRDSAFGFLKESAFSRSCTQHNLRIPLSITRPRMKAAFGA